MPIRTPTPCRQSRRGALGALLLAMLAVGCEMVPHRELEPQIHNPFPQLSKVAIAPFFNLSAEPSVDGRQFALAYYAALQDIPGYEVVPVGTVERALRENGLTLDNPEHVRRLGQILEVDAVAIGAVTDFTPFYPPRLGLHVEWYSTNPCFHEIPPGYGLPFGTPEEEQIPPTLALEAEHALARAQLKGRTPPDPNALPAAPAASSPEPQSQRSARDPQDRPQSAQRVQAVSPAEPAPPFARPACLCQPHSGAVMRHTEIYRGNDEKFTSALAEHYQFRDEARSGGWQSYLQRSDDFIRFCCHMHICQMLTARGGAGETRVVWQWSTGR